MLLIVDDDPKFLQKAEELLGGDRGAFLAASAAQARELLATVGAVFTAAIIDLDLPGEDGFSLIHELRQHFPELPTIAVSGVYREYLLESAKDLGAVAALRKPITPEWNSAIARARGMAAGG